MPPTAEATGFTLPSSTATTQHVASWGSIQGPITTAPAAWHRPRGQVCWPARIRCHSTTCSCVSYRAGTRWRKVLPRGEDQPAPKASPARGLKVVCSPANIPCKIWHPVKLILLRQGSRAIRNFYRRFEPAQRHTTPRALPARRRFNPYPSDGSSQQSHGRFR